MSQYLITFLSALTDASSLFVAAAGLTLVFGALRIINIAHGSFYAFGAFGVATLVGAAAGGWRFWLALVAVPLAVAALGGGHGGHRAAPGVPQGSPGPAGGHLRAVPDLR